MPRGPLNRRDFITLAIGAAAAWPLAMRAQPAAGTLRLGTVSVNPRSAPHFVVFERRLAELGYQQGKNFAFEFIQIPSIEEYESGFRDLVARKVDIILAGGAELGLKWALKVTPTLPIVIVATDYDPFARGYVTSLARPSSNVTGMFLQQIELTVKRLQVVKEAFPDMRAATVFWDHISADQWSAAKDVSAKLGLRLAGVELHEPPYDYDQALSQAPPDYRKNLFVLASPFFFRDRARLADLGLHNRIVSVFVFREWVDAGGLISYGPSIIEMYRRAADFVDRIAKGAKPADLPIEQPAKFELVVNLKTAKAIGVDLPTSLLLRANDVIE
jgi:putative tryptophan/tyrosine transport system substrate-binding protein